MLPSRSSREKAAVMIDFSLENSQAAEGKRDELAKARESIPRKKYLSPAPRAATRRTEKSMNPSSDNKFLIASCHSMPKARFTIQLSDATLDLRQLRQETACRELSQAVASCRNAPVAEVEESSTFATCDTRHTQMEYSFDPGCTCSACA